MVMAMSENKRYIIVGTDDFFQHIEDTTFTEDRHEGAIYNIYQVVRRLNEQEKRIQELEKENKQLQIEIMGQSEEIEILSDENTRLKQGKYVYGIHGGSNDRK